ncbi:hypothetical protein [Catenibacterium mitsuokai]|uniref:hypothetical protein n=1 Tax=Catenibacterium mitsuokai TaxID=100886 RepID=UPI003F8F3926
MAHINHYRQVNNIQRLSIHEAISPRSSNDSFGAFGGYKNQRDLIGLYEISRNIGSKGIVLIHNDPNFESRLSELYTINPSIRQRRVAPQMYLANSNGSQNSFYDPLYGLSSSDVLDVIAPIPQDSHTLSEVQSVRSALADYLEIISYQFKKNNNTFGKYPYNLDLLYEITSMSFTELNRNILAYLPAQQFDNLTRRLSAPEAQQRAFNAVRSFSLSLEKCLWKYKGFSKHSKLSIIDTVLSRNLISIYVPGSRKETLDYLAAEFKALNDRNISYLLITSNIAIGESPEFQKLFLNEHSALPYSTGILSEDISSIISSGSTTNNTALSSFFSQTQDIFVFSCSSTLAAAPFSDGIGNYYRQVSEQHNETHREPFHIFSSHGYGSAQREIQQAIINPEELTSLGDGCLIYGSNHEIPILAKHFIF